MKPGKFRRDRMSLQYSRFDREDGTGNVTLFHDGQMYTATSDHPNWAGIVDGLDNDDDSVVDLFDVSRVVARKFEALSERVRVAGSRVYFDGDEVDTTLTRQIIRFLEEDQDFTPLVRFYERLATNPYQESVDQLYRWLQSHDFTIQEDGKIIGYKGVQSDGDGGFQSVNTGKAIVNGEEVNGHVPNNVGDVIEMPRSDVTFDPDQTCSYGLHIGTWEYAQWWGRNGAILKVLVDPRDVVSVPSDSNGQKLRACRNTVLEVIEQEIKESVIPISETYDDASQSYVYEDEDDDFDGLCNCGCEDDEDDDFSYTDVTTATVVPVEKLLGISQLPYPQWCGNCDGPCTWK